MVFYHSHVATAIDVLIEGAAIDGDVGFAVDASHIREGRDLIDCIIQSCIRHAISATEDRTMEDSAVDIERYIAVGLTEGSIVAGIATIWGGRIIFVGSTSTCKDAILAEEFSTRDSQRNSFFLCVSIYITTRCTWNTFVGP